ncbi:MAG: transposase, partial [Pseudomonadota bacterium]
ECRREHQFQASLPGRNGEAALKLNFAAQRIKGGELLIVASNVSAGDALKEYRKRWSIECLFGDAKTRGFNLEDTRLLIPEKLSLLLALVALAIAWASKTAAITLGDKEIKVKKHGYRAKSWFRVGFDELRKMLRNEPLQAIAPWLEMMAARERVV